MADNPYNDGWIAFTKGLTRSDYPAYDDFNDESQWVDGWDAAQKKHAPMDDIIFSEELKEKLKPLSVVKMRKEVRHIRAIVDDEYVVYRVWGKRKRRWFYICEWWYAFALADQDGVLETRPADKE